MFLRSHQPSNHRQSWLGTHRPAGRHDTLTPRASGLICAGMAAGAAMTWFFDPVSGHRRRIRAADKLRRLALRAGDAAEMTARDVANRIEGLRARTQALFEDEGRVPDHVIEDRVRARLGRVVTHPRAIQVESDLGIVTLSGPIPLDEVEGLLRNVATTRGVCGVENRLEPHTIRNLPALQGGERRRINRTRAAERWSPATRLVAGATGVAAMAHCLYWRTLPAALIGTGGFALFVRAVSNLPARQLTGIGTGAETGTVHVQKIINIDAPPSDVFDYWANYDNFPFFMKHVRRVYDSGSGRSHWTVEGPAGTTVEWDAYLTDFEPDELIAWRSDPGAAVANEGRVRFQETLEGGTRVDVRLSYTPPGGALGEAVAWLFGADARSEMDDDLLRMKTLIENARFPHDAARHISTAGPTV
jgi:uncharacterized membrane protein